MKKKKHDKIRLLLTDRQCHIFLKAVHEFGYVNVTFDEIRRISNEVADGTYSKGDPVALLMRNQIDEAEKMIAERNSRIRSTAD